MALGDRTGPMGFGPRSGRGAGFCSGFFLPGFLRGAGLGPRFWRGHGWRHCFWATGLPGWLRERGHCRWAAEVWGGSEEGEAQELAWLKGCAEAMEKALSRLRQRIQTLEAEQAQPPAG